MVQGLRARRGAMQPGGNGGGFDGLGSELEELWSKMCAQEEAMGSDTLQVMGKNLLRDVLHSAATSYVEKVARTPTLQTSVTPFVPSANSACVV